MTCPHCLAKIHGYPTRCPECDEPIEEPLTIDPETGGLATPDLGDFMPDSAPPPP